MNGPKPADAQNIESVYSYVRELLYADSEYQGRQKINPTETENTVIKTERVERVETMSASLNYVYNQKWADRTDSNVTHQLNHEEGTVALPAEDSSVVVDVSDPDGLIEVRSGRQNEEFTDSEEAAEFALKQFFTV